MIQARMLSKHYGQTAAVSGLTFDIKPGVVTGFLGPNGAGKSTTLRMIMGLDRPSSGSVTVRGTAYRDLRAPMRDIGAMLDAKAVHPKRSARNHLAWLAQAGGVPKRRIDVVLDQVGLTKAANRKVGGFSLGMSQRLGIAAALLGDPEVLLFDEPVNGLDPDGIRWIRQLMRQLAAEGRTIVVSSHLMNEMEETADHVLVIAQGRLVADMGITEFMQRGTASHVRAVSPDPQRLVPLLERAGGHVTRDGDRVLRVTNLAASQVGDIAADYGIRLHELTPRRASLEDAFMELTHDSTEYTSEAAR